MSRRKGSKNRRSAKTGLRRKCWNCGKKKYVTQLKFNGYVYLDSGVDVMICKNKCVSSPARSKTFYCP